MTATINANANALNSGTYSSTITFTDESTGYVQSRVVMLDVTAALQLPSPPQITGTLTATASNGVEFSYQIEATNNPTSYGASGLPSGLTVSWSTGVISGATAATGTSDVTLMASNLGGTGSGTLVLTVLPPPPVVTSATATAISGVAFGYQIEATNSPGTYIANGLPAGLNVDASTGLVSGTTTVTGTDTVTLVASNAGGSGTGTLTLIVETPYQAWQSAVFTAGQLSNPAISGDTADPAGDGITNLMKYALGLNPFVDGVSGLPFETLVTTGSGEYLELTYTQVLSDSDITYTVQVSTDVQNWYSGAGYTGFVGSTLNAGGTTESVTVESVTPIAPGNPNQFLRLQVTGQ